MFKRRLLFLLLLLQLALSMPFLAARLERNRQALLMQFVCFVPASAVSIAPLFHDASAAWFAGFTARCLGNDELARQTWQAVLASPTERIDVLRAAYADDLELARLAAQANSQNAEAQFWLGDLLAAQRDIPGAIEAYQAGLSSRPNDGNVWVKLGQFYETSGDWQKAATAFDRACRLADRGKHGCPNAGRLYLEHGEYELAIDRFRRNLRQLSGYPAGLRGMAEALIALGRADEAIPYLQQLAASGDTWAGQTLQDIQAGQK